MGFICRKSSNYTEIDAIYVFNTLSLVNEPVLFSLHRQSLDSDPGLLYEPLFFVLESTELWVSQFHILKSCKIEAEDGQIHFLSLLGPWHAARLICPFIFHMDFGGFIILFMC